LYALQKAPFAPLSDGDVWWKMADRFFLGKAELFSLGSNEEVKTLNGRDS